MQYSPELEKALDAIQSIRTQADLNVLAEAWKNPTDFYCPRNGRMVKKGDTIQWESPWCC